MSLLKDQLRLLHIAWLRLRGKRCQPLKLDSQRIVIVAPHPDDEAIGCGGLIARLSDLGFPPHVIILSGGEGSHRGCCNMDETIIAQHRRKLTDEAARILGLPEENVHRLGFLDGKIICNVNYRQLAVNYSLIDGHNHNIEQLRLLLEELNPSVVFIPHHGEGWPDHVNVSGLMQEVRCKAEMNEYCVWMWYYNVWRLDWRNARVLHLSADEYRRKAEAIDAYTTPAAPCGKPWSGVLPKVFLKATKWDRELYFRVK